MKKLFIAMVSAATLSSCAMGLSPVTGFVYSNVKGPLTATGNTVGTKVGTAEARSYVGVVGNGDASIDAAAKKAGITKISHVDYHNYSILGIYTRVTVHVYGE